jgi:trans-2,3-dihydro-3-hydroxyanthranilate isomerase
MKYFVQAPLKTSKYRHLLLDHVVELETAKVDVFADDPLAGNPCNVVFEADPLDDVQMQRIAYELGPPMTVYSMRSRKADVRLRFFTPEGEEPLSGHGALGALWCMALDRGVGGTPSARHRAETPVGILPFSVDMGPEGPQAVWLAQGKPMFANVGDFKEVASALGVGADALFHDEFPLVRASIGLPCLLVPMRSLEATGKLEPRRQELLALAEDFDVAGVEVYTWNVLEAGATAHSRFFTPYPVFREEPGNGLAAGALAAYFAEYELVPRERLGDMVIEQGHWMGRPGRIRARIEKRGSTVRKVEIGGSALVSVRGRLLLA